MFPREGKPIVLRGMNGLSIWCTYHTDWRVEGVLLHAAADVELAQQCHAQL